MISNEQLKQKIIELAIKGNLLEPNLTLPAIDVKEIKVDNELKLPSNWKITRIDDVLNFSSGLAFNKNSVCDECDNSIRVLRGGNINSDYTYSLRFDDTYVEDMPYIKLKKGMMITPVVTSYDHIGKIAYIDNNLDRITAGGFVYIVSVKDEKKLYSKYALYFLGSNYHRINCIPNINKSGQAFYNLKKSGLIEQPIILPPIEDQITIANRIEELFGLIDKKERNDQEKENLKSILKNKILEDAIHGKLVENDLSLPAPEVDEVKEEKPYEIPSNWKWCNFDKVIDVRDGTHDSPKYVSDSEYPLITSKNLTDNGIDFSNVSYLRKEDYEEINKRSFVSDGDILFAMIGSIGNPVIVEKKRNFAIKNVALFKCTEKVNNKYLYYFLKSEKDMKSKTKGGVQKFVPLNVLRQYLLPLPPLEEQKKIVEKIEELFNLIDNIK